MAGNGAAGSANHQLNNPWGIYVSSNDTIFIVDRGNHRIQRLAAGKCHTRARFTHRYGQLLRRNIECDHYRWSNRRCWELVISIHLADIHHIRSI